MSELMIVVLVILRFLIVGIITAGTVALMAHFLFAYKKNPHRRFVIMGWLSAIIGIVVISIVWFGWLKIF